MTQLVRPVSRNSRCPCGSGLRYKECHGALGCPADGVNALYPLLASALAAQQQERFADAVDLYTRALALDPSNFDALHMLGVTHFQRQEFARAHALISAACKLRPDAVDATHNLLLAEGAVRHEAAQEKYRRWIATVESATIVARSHLRDAVARRADAPRFSLVMPAYNSPTRWLAACLESVLAQTYPHWELCIADDASTDAASREMLARYAGRDARIRVVWRAFNGHISVASNSALEIATGTFAALLDHDDVLPPHALGEVALALVDRPGAAILYTDEDKMDENGERFEPYFKPDWNPALATSQNFVSHLGVYRTDLMRAVDGFRQGTEGAQDWDLLLRCTERVEPARIHHVAQVLYHWRSIAGSTAHSMASKDYASAAQEHVVRECVRRRGFETAIVRVANGAFLQADPLVAMLPRISIVVLHPPSMPSNAAAARWSAHAGTAGTEILPVSVEGEAAGELADAPQRMGRSGAQAVNAAVATATGEVVVFVSASAAPTDDAWLTRLVAHALQPDTGCAGGVTFDVLQRTARGGYVLDPDVIAATAFGRERRGFVGMTGRNQVVQNLSALWLSGLAVRRAVWSAAGGLDVVHLGDAYHDIDLCLRIGERGLRHVWHPGVAFVDARALGVEAASMSSVAAQDTGAAYMRARHRAALAHDSAYNPCLSRPPLLFEIPDAGAEGAALSPEAGAR
jgi:cellulose synthase/poly-beta-1,6-N-acetylglucosamine synthase-like glycosyltransferase